MNIMHVKQLVRSGVIAVGVIGGVIVGVSRIQAAAVSSTSSNLLSAPDRPVAEHGFIILPEVYQFSVQSLLASTANITVSFISTNGITFSTTTAALPLESMGIYAAPTGFSGSSRIDTDAYSGSGNTPPMFATNFKLEDSGNSAYLGVSNYGSNCCLRRDVGRTRDQSQLWQP